MTVEGAIAPSIKERGGEKCECLSHSLTSFHHHFLTPIKAFAHHHSRANMPR
ncbi:hypothetical protein H6G97_14945 [Nostoc flagelliforme FACHB-838]|uniref:Uncharacterized protein n=1 Tax=Nostoc flagelliforme FACHB-838 TaxID=2692904 RepID=A0ABR8DPU8_9NOSO|nr:hypothetical protein [Nostoc flagelliforme]MBD2530802.1 hypothetical protein [Nostoc flagelliforme FACHB-838]